MISEDTLILYFYNDGLSPPEREQVRRAIERSEELRVRYTQLSARMNQIGAIEHTRAPAGSVTGWRQALDAHIDQAKASKGLFRVAGKQRFALAAAAALVFIAGWWFGGEQNPEIAPSHPRQTVDLDKQELPGGRPVAPKTPVVFVRGVSTYLERTQIQLASLDLGNADEREALIDQIVTQNRSFLQAADKKGADDVARLLRAFEPLLLEMMSDEQSPVAKEEMRDQLDFELGITLTKFARQASNKTNEF